MTKIVTIGGGSGQYGILTGLMHFTKNPNNNLRQEDISAIVTTFDTGGHTGVLMEARKPRDSQGRYLPPGDMRQCLAAMANHEPGKELFERRVTRSGHNKGASIGNDILDSYFEEEGGNFEKAIERARRLLDVRGNVLPCTSRLGRFYGRLKDGHRIEGENILIEEVMFYDSPIEKIEIEPVDIAANPRAVQAILEADKIIFSQGSLYTSLIANLAVQGIRKAVEESRARKIYVMNIVTQRGETDNFTARDHIRELERYIKVGTVDYIVMHHGPIPFKLVMKYEYEKQKIVKNDLKNATRVVKADLLNRESKDILRHDEKMLAGILLNL